MKYALIIGNNKYNDPKLAPLKTPQADSRELAKVLSAKHIGKFDQVSSLINPSEAKSRRAINAFLSNKKRDDLVLLYFSGHGVIDERGSLFLALKDTQIDSLNATAISSSFLSYELDNCRSKQQILILDCCNSGAFERGTKGEQKAVTQSTFGGSGSGRVVLTATDSTQFAFEGDQIVQQTELSLFTHFLLEGLKTGEADLNNDGQISLDEWYEYSHSHITAITPRQVPHKWSYHQQGELIIAQNPFVNRNEAFASHPLNLMLNQKLEAYRQHRLILDSKELEIVAAELENTGIGLEDTQQRLVLYSALAHGQGQPWLQRSGTKGLEWLRQAYQDQTCPGEVRRGAAAALGRLEDLLTYERLLDCIQQADDRKTRDTWLDVFTHYLNGSQQSHSLPWKLNRAVFARLAQLRLNEGRKERVRLRKVAVLAAPLCIVLHYVSIMVGTELSRFDLPIMLILAIVGTAVAFSFAEIMTSASLIIRRWNKPGQILILSGLGSVSSFLLYLFLSEQHDIQWLSGAIIGLALALSGTMPGARLGLKPILLSLAAGTLIMVLALDTPGEVLKEISAALFAGIYVYAANLDAGSS